MTFDDWYQQLCAEQTQDGAFVRQAQVVALRMGWEAAMKERIRPVEGEDGKTPNYRVAEALFEQIQKWLDYYIKFHPTDLYQIIEAHPETIAVRDQLAAERTARLNCEADLRQIRSLLDAIKDRNGMERE